MQSALDSAIGLPRRSTSASWMLVFLMPEEVRRNLNGCSFARGVGGASLRETQQRRTNHRSPEPSVTFANSGARDPCRPWLWLARLPADVVDGVRDLPGPELSIILCESFFADPR